MIPGDLSIRNSMLTSQVFHKPEAAAAGKSPDTGEPEEELSLSAEAAEPAGLPGGPEESGAGFLSSLIRNLAAPEAPTQAPQQGAGTVSALMPFLNLLSMASGGTIGLNGMTSGQNTWPGGGGVQSTQGSEDLISAFSQGSKGNCASVATIKAAMDAYGDEVFQSVTQNPDGSTEVVMKDGTEVSISAKEMKIAEQMADFEGMEGEDMEQAVLCYAVMAKNAQMEQNDGYQSYAGACRSLNNGEWPDDCARFLGLEECMMPVNPDSIEGTSYDEMVVWSNEHAVYMDSQNGQYTADQYGDDYAFDGTDTAGNDLEGAYTFV
ncbi:MAG: hypothetical protein RDV48_23410 [Candidatus Eremiobacteraeota bacterium]|nr:hypothetical protein [Candidatus Eremiobacteraeota bacterium]